MTTTFTPLRVGFIGLGMMGRGMATHVLAKGHPVSMLVRSAAARERCAALLAGGATALASSAQVAASADVLIICVTGSPEVEQVMLGPGGVLEGLKPGCVVVECSTSQPDSTRQLAAAVQAKGGLMLDAALTGTPKNAEEGQLNLLVGGDQALLEQLRPLFALFAKNIFYCGAVGAGHSTKLLHQFVVLGNSAILAEAFSCASKTGVDLAVLCDVIDSGGANSTAFQRLRPYVLEGNDQMFRFSIGNAHKDMRYYARMTGEAKAVAYLGDAVHNTYTVAHNQGYSAQFIPHLINSANTLNGVAPELKRQP
ncbi:MAG: NAD(P)-dependent oxidoreductase [Rhodoferax sp.]|nr:NAD(P)-dependent oxidoreductase [Rhodoferax sp.]